MDELRVETTGYSLGAAPPGPSFERREGERHLTLFRVGTLVIDGQRELCLIKNISSGGMMLRAYRDLAVGQPVSIELKHGQPLAGQISWIRDQQVGFTFDEPIDVLGVLAPVTDGPTPRMPRIETETYATVREGARTYHMRTCDISQGGIKVASTVSLPVGAEVVVTLPGLSPLPGSVRWAERGFVGITFNRLLALPTLVQWLQGQRDASFAA